MIPDLQSINPINLPIAQKQQMFKEFFILFIIFFTIDYFFIKYVSGPIFQVNIKNIQGSPMTIRYLPAAFAWLATVLTLYYLITCIYDLLIKFYHLVLDFLFNCLLCQNEQDAECQ